MSWVEPGDLVLVTKVGDACSDPEAPRFEERLGVVRELNTLIFLKVRVYQRAHMDCDGETISFNNGDTVTILARAGKPAVGPTRLLSDRGLVWL